MIEIKKHEAQNIFDSYDDYISHLKQAYALLQDIRNSKNPSFSKIVPEHLEVEFTNSTKTVRLYYPRNKGIIIIQFPMKKGVSAKKRNALREKALITFGVIVKINERAMAEEFAISKKIFDSKT